MSEESLNIPTVSAEILLKNRLPINFRLRFQRVAFAMLGLEHNMDSIIGKYGKAISDYIDNPENTEVRDLILSDIKENYEKAAKIVIDKVAPRESKLKAA